MLFQHALKYIQRDHILEIMTSGENTANIWYVGIDFGIQIGDRRWWEREILAKE